MHCASCGTDNPAGARFCSECAAPLARVCPVCGFANGATAKFCNECAAPLAGRPAVPAAAIGAPIAERRLVSVLFADLVGFTTLSEQRDAEEVRDLLSRYFESCSRLISVYGGTVEKFIGDAVMAVWGAPSANEDDAERAVRAALDVVAMVKALGQEVGEPLEARAGVLTGEAAVTVGATGQGMVAGDLVNTASRIQSIAEPGSVVVGDATRRSSEASIAYEDAGERELKGKSERVRLWRALRVVAGARGSQRTIGLEPPFVGRDRELRLVKELFHASAEEGRAQLVSITGIAGIGKSRLAWEFEKYIDGIAGEAFWHRGRCPSYGDGVAYWALAEMVRMRCGIVDDDDPATARAKLDETLDEHLPDADERRWVAPRLARLLGLEEGAPGDEENLFSAWRVLFERLAEQAPTILVFEDLQWADSGLLDFLEYLLEWSRAHPLFVLALARPEFADRRPTWGAGKRNFTQLYLDPLSPAAMGELLAGLIDGLPDDLRDRILERAEGVPLYAVETVRMLVDRGVLALEGNAYRPTGPVETLDVPETLQALVAARLDGLTLDERRLVQDGSVLGKTFTHGGLGALSGFADDRLQPLLAALLRKEILSVQADPRSPERGQYAFLQDIVKRVAYDTLSRQERKAKHLAAAHHLEQVSSSEEDELVELVATHYIDAYEAVPDAPDAAELRARAAELFARSGERASSLAAPAEALRAYERAAALATEPLRRADLLERAGLMAQVAVRPEEARAHYEAAIAIFAAEGETHPAARVSARHAELLWDRGRIEEGLADMDRAFSELSKEEPDEDLAALAAQLGRFLFFSGDSELGGKRLETALEIAEALALPEVLSQALNTKGVLLVSRGRLTEGIVLLRYALETALEHDRPSAALRAYFNYADTLSQVDRYEDAARTVREGLVLARRAGNRYWEWQLMGQMYSLYALGEWDTALELLDRLPREEWETARQAFSALTTCGLAVHVHRGSLDEADEITGLLADFGTSADVQERSSYQTGVARVLFARRSFDQALATALEAIEAGREMSYRTEFVKEAWSIAVDAALALRDREQAERLLADVEGLAPGVSSQFLQAQATRFRARLGPPDADRLFRLAAGLFRELAMPFFLGVTLLEQAEALFAAGQADDAAPALDEAVAIFDRLGARPWLARAAEANALPVG
ncbi:MAG TPA: adenylate/guanylate cyclase domain-containing protein [Gaiellaceae bacterium]